MSELRRLRERHHYETPVWQPKNKEQAKRFLQYVMMYLQHDAEPEPEHLTECLGILGKCYDKI